MADSNPTLANALTVEAPRQSLSADGASTAQLELSARRRVALVEGSTPHMSSETRRGRAKFAVVRVGKLGE